MGAKQHTRQQQERLNPEVSSFAIISITEVSVDTATNKQDSISKQGRAMVFSNANTHTRDLGHGSLHVALAPCPSVVWLAVVF